MTIWDEIDTIYNQAGENGEGACTFSVPGTFSGYRGHFPGNPILPESSSFPSSAVWPNAASDVRSASQASDASSISARSHRTCRSRSR